MTLTAAEKLRDTWASIFRRKGADGVYTRLFDNLELSQQSMLLAKLKLRASELPVIGSTRDSNNWLVLTTERLVWSVDNERKEIATDIIRDAKADLQRLRHSDHGKLGMQDLQIVLMDGRGCSIELESGAPLSGAWNVLKNLGARNRHIIERA